MNAPPNQNCPEVDVLQELAAGIGSPELAQQTMQHVARCATCSAALRSYISEFSEEQSPENAALFNQLQSSKPQWQKQLVHDQIGGGKRFPWLKLVPAMAALAVAIFAVIQGPALLADFKVNQAQKQVAAAFAGRRTTEMRLPSVSHSDYRPFPIELGGENGRSLDEVPTSLHDASGAANQNLLAAKADPRWLQVQGLALLWESTPSSLEKAEKDFERARADGLATPSLEIDLAASYFERDSRAEHPNLQRTLNLLSEVLSKPTLANDDRASALFNLALAYEKTQAWDMAVSTWEKYLQIDRSSDWAKEAHKHLNEGKAKISSRPQQSYSDPSFFLRQKAQGNLRPEDPEQYQQKALSQWLPTAVADQQSDAYKAVNGLAEVFAEHQDFWWRDFLKETKPSDLDAVRELSDAVLANDEGHYSIAEKSSQQAVVLFNRQHNEPGELRASFEGVYAHRRILKSADCIARADPLAKSLSDSKYIWLSARVFLELAECRNIFGAFAESDESLAKSRTLANDSHYPMLQLQDIGISVGMKRLRGNCDESWKDTVDGLELYWETLHVQGERLFQFYAVMLQCSLETGALDVARALIEHTIAMRQAHSADIQPDATIDGLLHLHLANILLARGDKDLSSKEHTLALTLLNQPSEPSANKYRLVSEIEPAEFQLQQGQPKQAFATLEPLISLLPKSQDKFFSLRCRQLLGDIYFELGEYDNSLKQYQEAINLAETSLSGMISGNARLSWLRATDQSYRGLVRVLLAQKKDRDALDQWEWYQSRPMFKGATITGSGDPAGAIAPRLKKNGTYDANHPAGIRVVYAEFRDGLQIWILENGSIRSKWVTTDQQDFELQVHDFVKKCATESSNLENLQRQGVVLYSLIVEPILSDISRYPVITVELDRRIYNLPIEALRSPNGWYFGERHAVIYSSGNAIDTSLHEPQPITFRENLLLVDATHSPKSGYLPGMADEGKTILELFAHSKMIDSTTAQWTGVKQSLMHSQIFHYMGHGLPDGTGTSLLFNGVHALRAQDFTASLFQHSQLVVLAACSSGKGQEGLLDTGNLVHALLDAGVPRIIASQWNVDSESTSQFMQRFYRDLGKDETVAQAMMHARREMLGQTPHPYYWASFSLAGVDNK
jgi:CHAT domain-containing protein